MKNKFFNKIGTMIKGAWTEVTTYWSKPNASKNESVCYREFTSFCLGATFSNSIAVIMGYLSFSAGCLLVGAIYGISFKDIYLIGFINLPLGYLMSPINMLVQDNLGELSKKLKIFVHTVCISLLVIGTALMFIDQVYFENIMPAFPQLLGSTFILNAVVVYFKMGMYKSLSKRFGKFRPWILAGALPCIISLCLMVYLPFRDFVYPTRLWVLNFLFGLYNTFIAYTQQIGNIQNVISPNTDERGKLMSIGGFIYSSVPSLVAILLPVFATMLGGFTNLRTYQVLFPIMFIVFSVGVIVFFGFGVKEKVLLNVNHKPKVNLKKGFGEVLKNKYFWIQNISNLGMCITAGSVALTNVLIIYSLRADWLMGIYAGIIGTASIPGLLFALPLMKKFGKKNLILFSKFALMLASAGNLLAIYCNSFILFLVVNYVQILVVGPAAVAQQAMGADIWDYQQWRSGERLDGCSGIFGLILQPITILGGMLVPAVYAFMGFTTDWDILYVSSFRNKILFITIIISAVSALLTALPYFFYDLTDAKHRKYMEEIAEREGLTKHEEATEGCEFATEGGALLATEGAGMVDTTIASVSVPETTSEMIAKENQDFAAKEDCHCAPFVDADPAPNVEDTPTLEDK